MFFNKNRWRNKAMWVVLVTHVLAVLEMTGLADVVPASLDDIKAVLFAVIEVLTILGILMDPTTPGVSDPKVKEDH